MTYRLGYTTWLEEGGRRVLDEDDADLVWLVSVHRSMTLAAADMRMSIEDVRSRLDAADARAGTTLIDRDTLTLTAEGERLLRELDDRRDRMTGLLRDMYRNPVFTVDGVVVCDDAVLLVKRGRDPYAGLHALPGGFIGYGESAIDAVVRELEEETGLRTEVLDLVGAYTRPGRDPRGHICTLAYRLVVRGGSLRAGDDASEAAFHPLDALPELAFDHAYIVEDALRARQVYPLRNLFHDPMAFDR